MTSSAWLKGMPQKPYSADQVSAILRRVAWKRRARKPGGRGAKSGPAGIAVDA